MSLAVILHNIRSLHNVGSIFRTADGAGVLKIYLCGITPEPLDRFGRPRESLSKVALGAEHTVPWEKCGSTARVLTKLKKEGYTIVALEQATGSVPLDTSRLKKAKKIALVLGEEVNGLPRTLLNASDFITEIPMRGKKESLNVSVAFGIAAYALTTP